jgi:hypothetical protein
MITRLDIHTRAPDLNIEINHEWDDGVRLASILRMNGGEWQLMAGAMHGWRFVATRRVSWPEALKRALIEIDRLHDTDGIDWKG